MRFYRFAFVALACAGAAIAGCGGGGSSSTPPAPGPTPHVGPTTIPVGPTSAPQTVLISGAGYTLNFALPAVTVGNPGTVTATLQAAPPANVPAPPASVVGSGSALVYLTISSTATVGFSALPAFTWTLPSATTVPSGASTYMTWWDQSAAKWVAHLGPGVQSGSTVNFAGAPGGLTFSGGAQYVYAFAAASAPTPTATPAPTPTAVPTTLPVASYCSNYTSNSSAGAVSVNLTDDSATGGVLVAYITGVPAGVVGANTYYMDTSGNFTSTTAIPFPAACFSTTVGSAVTNKPLTIPAGYSGRIYLALATPNPNASIAPNPFLGIATSGPTLGYQTNPFPWDKVEYGTTDGATIDTTQVDALGLPIELSVVGGALPQAKRAGVFPPACPANGPNVVGVTSCNFAQIFSVMNGISEYKKLVVAQSFNGPLLDMQIVSPAGAASATNFQWDLFDLPSYVPAPTPAFCPASPSNGYLSCLVNAYNTPLSQARLFTTSNIGALNVSNDNYCATSDGASAFLFTDVGTATNCAAATPNPGHPLPANPFRMPLQELTYGTPPALDGSATACKTSLLFSQPWGNANVGAGHIFYGPDAFALWKDLTADINRGTMLSTSAVHPLGLTSPSMGIFFQDPMFNTYVQVMHTYFDNNLAYAIPYDDTGGFESGVIWHTGQPFNIRINAIPKAGFGTAQATPLPPPSSCPALPINVGST